MLRQYNRFAVVGQSIISHWKGSVSTSRFVMACVNVPLAIGMCFTTKKKKKSTIKNNRQRK